MRINIEEEVYGKLSLFAGRLGWTEREALGLLGLLWHDSQCEGAVVCTKDEIFDFCRLYKEQDEEKEKILKALIRSKFVHEVPGGMFEIKGNTKQVGVLSAYKERAAKARKSKIQKIVGNKIDDDNGVEGCNVDNSVNNSNHNPVDNSVHSAVDSSIHSPVNSQQCNAIQSNTIQSSSKQNNPKQSNATQNKTSVEEFDFSKFWEKYPNDGRLNKPEVVKRFKEQIKTKQQFDDLLKSIDNYVLHLKATKKTCKHATSFFGTSGPKSQGNPWIDFVDDPHLPETIPKHESYAEKRSADRWAMVEELERKQQEQQEQFEREVVDANG